MGHGESVRVLDPDLGTLELGEEREAKRHREYRSSTGKTRRESSRHPEDDPLVVRTNKGLVRGNLMKKILFESLVRFLGICDNIYLFINYKYFSVLLKKYA